MIRPAQEWNLRVPADVIYHAPKGQTIAGVARDHFRGHVPLQALSGGLNLTALP
jgi:hypothetical protein